MVRLQQLVRPWAGTGIRHVAAGRSRPVLDDTYLGVAANNRWNHAGIPAYYFAPDLAVVTAEFARHVAADPYPGAVLLLERDIWEVGIHLQHTLDLRDPAVVGAMGAPPIRTWIFDGSRTRAASEHLRAQTDAQGLIVPSVAFLDDPDRCNVVVFRDRVDPSAVFGVPRWAGRITLDTRG